MKRYHHTEATDALIREAYTKLRQFGNRRAIPAVGKRFGWPRHAISKRAKALGLSRAKERPWSPEEIAVLEKWAHLSLPVIARKMRLAGFSRSETAIHLKAKRRLIRQDTLGWYTLCAIANGMGIDVHKVSLWVRNGWLKAAKKGSERTSRQGGDIQMVSAAELRRFLLNHPDEYDLAPVEKFWFLDIITGGKLCEAFRAEVA